MERKSYAALLWLTYKCFCKILWKLDKELRLIRHGIKMKLSKQELNSSDIKLNFLGFDKTTKTGQK